MVYKKKVMDKRLEVFEKFRVKNDIPPPKCISDKILLYLRYGIERATIAKTDEDKKVLYDNVMKIYERIRGDMRYTNQTPLGVAAGILYIAIMLTDMKGRAISQDDIAEYLNVANVTVRKYYKMINDDFKIFDWSLVTQRMYGHD